jgi:hypothetical protein
MMRCTCFRLKLREKAGRGRRRSWSTAEKSELLWHGEEHHKCLNLQAAAGITLNSLEAAMERADAAPLSLNVL